MADQPITPAFLQSGESWAKEHLQGLSLREKIAQLIHVPSWSNRGENHEKEILHLVQEYGIGGVIFFQGDPVSQANMTNAFQAQSPIPLMISIDGEWGLGMRLENSIKYPYQITLGALEDDSLIYEMGQQIGRQCKRLGIHVNFAPCVDINTEPSNPVIGFRSFGEEAELVTKKAMAYMQGMQEEGVMAVAKHFPGHGDTAVDSHFSLPILPHDKERLESIELYPFRQLIKAGIGGVMPGHLHVPVYDDNPKIGATLSAAMTTDLLQKQMGFEGMVFTDALDMKGVSKFFTPAEINAKAYLAGNDALLFCVDVPGTVAAIEKLILSGESTEAELDRRCMKVLQAKAWLGLDQYQPIKIEKLVEDLHPQEAQQLLDQIGEQALKWTGEGEIPKEKVAIIDLHVNPSVDTSMAHHELSKTETASSSLKHLLEPSIQNGDLRYIQTSYPFDSEKLLSELNGLEAVDRIWIYLHGLPVKARDQFGLQAEELQLFQELLAHPKAALLLLASPYVYDLIGTEAPVLHGFEDSGFMRKAIAKRLSHS